MIPLLRRETVRALDRDASERLGIPSLLLMENAGLGATEVLLREFGAAACASAVVVGGLGQNGGDAWVLARQLLVRGLSPRCYVAGDPAKIKGDARVNFDILRALGREPARLGEAELAAFAHTLSKRTSGRASEEPSPQVVVDGLFGTGLDRDLEGFPAALINVLNRSEVPIFALDLPSGLDADSGQARGVAVRARCTATFAAHKPGLHQFPGVELSGKVHCVAIGVPVEAQVAWGVIEGRDVADSLPVRGDNVHKGSNGSVLALAGSAGKTGAAVLSSLAALRAGAGLVTVATNPDTRRALDQKVVEVMTASLSEHSGLEDALALARHKDAALLGPGFGLSPEQSTLAFELALQLPLPCVLDADALTAVGRRVAELQKARGPRVLTPHPGEASRLLGSSVSEIERDRCSHALRLAQESGQVVVLKGARTVIASPGGELRVCESGTPALATAGSGDVLSGVIATLCTSVPTFVAAWAGVELHARAGRLAARGDRGLLAGEIAGFLSTALEACRRA